MPFSAYAGLGIISLLPLSEIAQVFAYSRLQIAVTLVFLITYAFRRRKSLAI